MSKNHALAILFLLVTILVAGLVAQQAIPAYEFGAPLPGLTSDQLSEFSSGQAQFQDVETVADGLGPVFNESSCSACHTSLVSGVAAVGGTNQRLETRFGKITGGAFDPLEELGGSLMQDQGIGWWNGVNFVGEKVPSEANVVAHRRTTPLFGLGLVDAVPDPTFQELARLEKLLTPGTGGTLSIVTNLATGSAAVGKFGWKAQNPTLFQFAGDAYLNEMGITNPQFPNENCPQGDCSLLAANPKPGLNDDGTDVQEFTDFMMFLAPPPPGPTTPQSKAGERIFYLIGCANCHFPTLVTGRNAVAALNQVVFHPYSDFLLHDMGALGDGITQNAATGSLMRTAPLWGLRIQSRLLHDGRALTAQDAILAHDGQGKTARNLYTALTPSQKANLLAFLNSL